MYTSKAEEYSN